MDSPRCRSPSTVSSGGCVALTAARSGASSAGGTKLWAISSLATSDRFGSRTAPWWSRLMSRLGPPNLSFSVRR